MPQNSPSVFDYLDYRHYLKDYYAAQKAKNKGFSFQTMAWKAGFRSKSFFSEVIAGKKNVSSNSVFSVGQALGLQGNTFSYFEALIAFNQSKTAQEKEHGFRKLMGLRLRGEVQVLARQQFKFYSQWHHNSIRELVTWFDFKGDFNLLGRQLTPRINGSKARASVRLLESLGLIVRDGQLYRQTHSAISTGDEVFSTAISKFHQQNLKLASASIDTVSGDERDISTLVVGLSPQGFKRVKTQIQEFRKKLIETIRQDQPAHRVYHINFQFFPTSEATDG
jgi:uncharacterized protein (TIGR02147 family)